MKTCIYNGTVVFRDHLEQIDLLIENERITALGSQNALPEADTCIDASDCYIFPGFIDIHTHLDDMIANKYLADTYKSGSQIALLNGITTFCSFITQKPDETLATAIEAAKSKALGNSYCDYMWHLTPTRFGAMDWEEIENCINNGFNSFKFYTTYRKAGLYTTYDDLENRIKLLNLKGCVALIHCEDDALLEKARQGEHVWQDPLTHSRIRPMEAEVTAIKKIIEISRRTGARIHIVHVSTPEGIELIQAATDVQATCETCPQYLFLDESYLARQDGHRWICSPPLRSHEQRKKLCSQAQNGDINMLATDHCAFRKTDKDDCNSDVRQAKSGLAGLGALPHLCFKLFQMEKNEKAMVRIANMLSTSPAKFIGQYPRKGAIRKGSDADLTVINPAGPEKSIVSSLADTYETYPELKTTIEIKYVFLRGQLVVKNGLLQTREPMGACLCGK